MKAVEGIKWIRGLAGGYDNREISILTGAEVVDGQQTTLASVRLSECLPPGVQRLRTRSEVGSQRLQ